MPRSFKLRWPTIWTKERTQKECGLLWAIWHRAVAVNEWRGRIDGNIDQSCVVCGVGKREPVLHRFRECPSAQYVWTWSNKLITTLCPRLATVARQRFHTNSTMDALDLPGGGPPVSGSITTSGDPFDFGNGTPTATMGQFSLTWKQGIFSHRIPRRFKHCSRIWSLIRGLVLWGL